MQQPVSHEVCKLVELLELDQLDRDLYRGSNSVGAVRRSQIFGGQVAAQATRAAGLTVDDDRHLHSLHGYFLRAGRADRPTIFHVERDRDGKSYSARRVVAKQDGDVVMSVLASFHVDEGGPEYPSIGLPEGVSMPEDLAPPTSRFPYRSVLDLRVTGFGRRRGEWAGPPHQFWARARGSLSEERLLHACVLTYVSDVGSGIERAFIDEQWWGPSLDHAVWFHHPVRLDDWVLVDLCPGVARGGRAFYTGTVHDRAGRLVASIAQEHVLRLGEHRS
jgi:acyl-CoA thioesterase-2